MRFTGTGYGAQTAAWVPRIASLGHEVAISAFYGLNGARTKWNGHLVYPAGFDPYGSDVIPGHARHFRADLVITLMDIFALDAEMIRDMDVPVAHWMPVDCDPLGMLDRASLEISGAQPIAMSEHGRAALEAAGFDPFCVPHGIDTKIFAPRDKAECRKTLSLPEDAFIVGINAANKDQVRKGFPEQMAAFAGLRAKHPDALLLIHSVPQATATGGASLTAVAQNLGIQDAIRWADPYSYAVGAYASADMAAWYGCLDLYSGCSYAEGFGLPILEAQACGVPVVVTDASAMSELCGAGWKVAGEPHWNAGHMAWWAKPYVGEIAAAYEHAYNGGVNPRRGPSREFALRYDADQILTSDWKPVLDLLEHRQ